MKSRYLWMALIILSLVFLAPSPSVAQDMLLDSTAVTPIFISAPKGYPVQVENYLSKNEYRDPTLHVVIEEDRYLDTDMWIARIQIAHPSQLRTAMAGRYGSQTTAVADNIAKRVNAVTAINGDYHSYVNYGVVLRQGHLYRNKPSVQCDILMLDDQGNFHTILSPTEETFTVAYEGLGGAYEDGGKVVDIFTFGPVLVQDGKQAHEAFLRPDKSENKLTQRTVFAQVDSLSYLFVLCEGPESPNSKGLTLQQMADYMLSLGCETAYNFDGGSSSTLVFQEKKINSLSTRKKRPISDIVYFSSGILIDEVTEK